jgi:hypothetical protein
MPLLLPVSTTAVMVGRPALILDRWRKANRHLTFVTDPKTGRVKYNRDSVIAFLRDGPQPPDGYISASAAMALLGCTKAFLNSWGPKSRISEGQDIWYPKAVVEAKALSPPQDRKPKIVAPAPPGLTTIEAANMIGVSQLTLAGWRTHQTHLIKSTKHKGHVIYDRAAVEEFAAAYTPRAKSAK